MMYLMTPCLFFTLQVQVVVSEGHRSQAVRPRHPPFHLPQLYNHRPGEAGHSAQQHGSARKQTHAVTRVFSPARQDVMHIPDSDLI